MNLKEPGKFDTAVHYAEFEIGDTFESYGLEKI